MSTTDRERIAAAIRDFHERAQAASTAMEKLHDAIDMAPESPLYQTMWGLVGGYIAALDAAFHIGGWLEWWWEECRLGDNPNKAGLPGEAMRLIENLDDVAAAGKPA